MGGIRLSKSAAARYLQISYPTFDKRLKLGWYDGFLEVYREKGREYFKISDLDSYIEAIRNAA